ncbi:MAG: hypothetical protein V1738_03830 [Patescibacteria group bacterium]
MPQLIGPGELIVVSWENFRRNYLAYGELVVWILVLSILQWLMMLVVRATVPGQLEQVMLFTILSVPTSLAFLVVTATMIDVTAKGIANRRIDVRESLHHGFHRLLPLLWVSIITSLAIFFGFFLLIVPALLFFVWFKFAPYHTVTENISGHAAMSASRSLVVGRFWSVLLRIIVPMLFFSVIASLFISLIYLFIGASFGDMRLFFGEMSASERLSQTHMLITVIVPQTIRSFALAFILGADVALWQDLKRRG